MRFFLACALSASDAEILDAGLEVQLDAGWTAADGLPIRGARRVVGSQTVAHPIELPPGWDAGHIELVVDGSGWEVRARVDGVEVAHDEGGGWPARLDLSTRLSEGPHQLELVVEPADAANVPGQPLSAWTFRVPQRGLSQWGGRARLVFGAPVSIRTRLIDGRLSATLDGAEGPIRYAAVRDGKVLARWTDDVAWSGPRWPGALVWLVATDEAGHRWQARTGVRSIETVATGQLTIDGVRRYLAARRLDLVRDGEPRQEIFRQVANAALFGGNAGEWHGDALSGAALDVLDELGLPVVGVPRCAGRRQHDGHSGPDQQRDGWLAARDDRAAAVWASHPAAVAWVVEYAHPGVRPVFTGFRAMGLPFYDVDRARTILEAEWPGARLPPWIIELPWTSSAAGYADRVATLLRAHAGGTGAGMEVPLPDAGGAFARIIPATLRELGVNAWDPTVSRRGPATVDVDVGKAGTLVLLEVPEQPPVGAFADATGIARIELDYAGPGTIRTVGGTPVAVTLTPGEWREDGWHPSITTVRHR